jgi:hypothetical protein
MKELTCYHGNPWLDHFDPPIGTGQGCSLCQTDIRGERHDMAKQSKLDLEIQLAKDRLEVARSSFSIADNVYMALLRAKGQDETASEPKVKRGRKAKGLPKPNGAEVTA